MIGGNVSVYHTVRNLSGRYKMSRCLVCNKKVSLENKQLPTPNGPICMGCEFTEIEVWHVTSSGNGGYYDTHINNFTDMLNECDYGEGYTIKKEKMRAAAYYNLPEFTGF